MFYEWYKLLFDYVNEFGMFVFSLLFDEQVVDFLDELNVFCFKIVLFELIDMLLVCCVVSKGKLFIMFIGMVSLSEIEQVVCIVCEVGCEQIILLKCISIYLVDLININLNIIFYL